MTSVQPLPLKKTNPATGRLDVVVVGGCGHVGLPLALSFTQAGMRVGIYDVDAAKVASVAAGEMPFKEAGAEEALTAALEAGSIDLSASPEILDRSDCFVLVIGTPIDEFMNPSLHLFERGIDQVVPHLAPRSMLILRSTVYPGMTDYVDARLRTAGLDVDVVFCPERIAEGHALEEMRTLPQLIGARTERGFEKASALFMRVTSEVIRLTPKEAEVAKLMTNAWRYMKFAIANQFFQIAHGAGLDYQNILHAVRHEYPRAADLPGPGFAAGPCLFKDTMQLAAFTQDHFPLGHAAMLVNEGLPSYIVDSLDRRRPLAGRTVGILGMAFKGESDDPRSSLSYKLRKLAAYRGARVLCSDPYVADDRLVPQEQVIQESDVIVIGAPHRRYAALELAGQEVVDVWGVTGRGILL